MPRKLLEKRHNWWLNALAERRTQQRDQDILPVFFRVRDRLSHRPQGSRGTHIGSHCSVLKTIEQSSAVAL